MPPAGRSRARSALKHLAVARRPLTTLRAFLWTETGSGFLLIAASLIALVWANSPLAPAYFGLLGTHVRVGIAPLALAGIPGTLCAPFDRDSCQPALAPHLATPDPRVEGRARAALFGSRRMAERVLLAYRELAGDGE